MSDDERKYDCLYQLSTRADHLNAIDTPGPCATAKYEIMSGALIWADEIKPETPVFVIWALRGLFAYRTQLMRNNLEPDNDYWTKCVALFPKWIGFLPERRKQTPERLAEFRRGDVSLKWCLRKVERKMEADK